MATFPQQLRCFTVVLQRLQNIARFFMLGQDNSVWLFGGSIPERSKGNLYNTCMVFDPRGNLAGTYR